MIPAILLFILLQVKAPSLVASNPYRELVEDYDEVVETKSVFKETQHDNDFLLPPAPRLLQEITPVRDNLVGTLDEYPTQWILSHKLYSMGTLSDWGNILRYTSTNK